MKKVKVLIADDDFRVRDAIERILAQNFTSIDIVALSDTVNNTVDSLYRVKPHIAILNIHLIGGTALDVIKKSSDLDYKVIFMSTYQEYALEDIRFASIDFIYKPLDISEFIVTVDQVISSLVEEGYHKKIQTLFTNTKIGHHQKQIILKSSDRITSVSISDIICGESLYGKSKFHFASQKAIETSKPLRRYEAMLQSYMFYRCHMQFMVNLNHVRKVDFASQTVLMSNGMAIPADTRRIDGLKQKLQRLVAKDLSLTTSYRMAK
ncbi:LytR/AlgR family response regulator transcription factor [Saccharicrinis sp. 156]|uniref:LytR/AlgR family response regulator transcription factor n=1 Tax=Saccharicrinis sp. 156 TaxID=3417574 RepID=UPI003D34A6CA